ncbi:MAG: hypothetical protein HUJ91_04545 [Bacteroidales bacterium]|nr:hypothetical protein [Bacteroidales bacterium]
MRITASICRVIVGLTFAVSGFLKLLAPVGTSLIVSEYFGAFGLDFLQNAAFPCGVLLALTEFLLGISALLRLKERIMAWPLLILVSIFTLLTLYLAVFNPIADCGCFGEAVHLTNWQTFGKNLILLPCAVVVFLYREASPNHKRGLAEWGFILFYFLIAVGVIHYTRGVRPIVEFTPYKVGAVVETAQEGEQDAYSTRFIYEKDGARQVFTLDNLPDSTWAFVDAETTHSSMAQSADSDFCFENNSGENITDYIMESGDMMLLTVYDPESALRHGVWETAARLKDECEAVGMDFVVAASRSVPEIEAQYGFEVALADRKLLMTLNRSNGGAIYMSEGVILSKVAAPALAGERFSPQTLKTQDNDVLLIYRLVRQRIDLLVLVLMLIFAALVKDLTFRFGKSSKQVS